MLEFFLMMNGRENFWLPIIPVAILLGLLILLAFLQYNWLGQISEGERERLQKRLQTDTERFAQDFEREIGSIYLSFQLEAAVFKEKKIEGFNKRLQSWRENTEFPRLVADIYFIGKDETLFYDTDRKTFIRKELPNESAGLSEKLKNNEPLESNVGKNTDLIIPIYESAEKITIEARQIPLNLNQTKEKPLEIPRTSPLVIPNKYGILVIQIDESVIKNEVLPTLTQRYFSDSESSEYKIAVIDKQDESKIIFAPEQNKIPSKGTSDVTASIFNNAPENFAVFLDRNLPNRVRQGNVPGKAVVITQKFESRVTEMRSQSSTNSANYQFQLKGEPRTSIFQSSNVNKNGRWLLLVQHSAGSLEQFITNTRNKNLAVSFGILSLLAISVIMIFLSARRAKALAQKQMDFVSAVSHEFRTPLAVIYSASENLTDGVVSSEKQIAQYGNLIKREGKKLSAMVEQILEFAGARSGKKKYNFVETKVRDVLEDALLECQPLLDEKGFQVEIKVQENLPTIKADANSLSHAIQNLINNSIKYSETEKIVKISAENGDGKIKISVEDKGIGIAAHEISQIFTPFYRGKDVVDAQIHGNGLGLSLVKQTVEAHGGKISVESKVGEGSKFTIRLAVSSRQIESSKR